MPRVSAADILRQAQQSGAAPPKRQAGTPRKAKKALRSVEEQAKMEAVKNLAQQPLVHQTTGQKRAMKRADVSARQRQIRRARGMR